MYEGDDRVSQSCDGVMSVPRVIVLVRSRTPVEVEEELRLAGNLPTHYQGVMVGGEGGNRLRETCRSRIYFRRGANEP